MPVPFAIAPATAGTMAMVSGVINAAGRLNSVCTFPYTPNNTPAMCSENPATASLLWQIPGSSELRIAIMLAPSEIGIPIRRILAAMAAVLSVTSWGS